MYPLSLDELTAILLILWTWVFFKTKITTAAATAAEKRTRICQK